MNDRAQRPRPERTMPNRNPAEILRGLGATGGDTSPGDPIARSVNMGYQIVEQYLEQGRNMAAGIAPRGGSSGGNVMADLTQRMLRTTADFFEVWFQLMDVSGATRGRAAHDEVADPSVAAQGETAGTAPPPPPTGVQIQLVSSRPATVSVDLRPVGPSARLVAHSLRSEVDGLPRVTGIAVEPSLHGGPVTIRIPIPDAQPEGVYNGMIIDETSSLPVGTISVRLAPREQTS